MALTSRLDVLNESLDHRDNRAVAEMVAQLFAGYLSTKMTRDELGVTISAYVSALSNQPPWAVAEAVTSCVRGGGSAFAPSASQLYEATNRITRRLVTERAQILFILDAALPDDGIEWGDGLMAKRA